MNYIHTYDRADNVLQEEWLNLWERSPMANPFNSPMWFRATTKTYNYKKQLIVTVRNEGALVAIFPLVENKRFGISGYMFPGNEHIDMSSLLIADHDREVLRMIVTYLARTETFYLQEVSEETKEALTNSTHALVIEEASRSPYFSLGTNPFRYMPDKELYKLNRKAKRYEHDLDFHSFWGDTGGLLYAFEIDSRSTKSKTGKSLFNKELNRELYLNLAQEFKEMFHIDVLFYKEIPMVYSVGFIHKKTYYAVNTAFDLNLKHIIPGKMILHYLINKLSHEDIALFYFSRGTSELKKQFTPHTYPQYDVYYSKQLYKQVAWSSLNKLANAIINSKPLYKAYKKISPLVRAA